ncbi:MAG: MauE/DoxX family redox-associated membrane protein [Thermoanaerobaculia bacterium]
MKLRDALLSPWLTVRVQIALGAIFVVAALPKIVDPPSFAHMIYNYRLVPGFAINFLALVMPWVELLTGIALILGVWRRSAAALIGAMLLVFIVAIGINLARDNAIDCGCFEVNPIEKTHDQLIADMWIVLLRDVGMMFMVAQIWMAAGASSKFEVRSSKA